MTVTLRNGFRRSKLGGLPDNLVIWSEVTEDSIIDVIADARNTAQFVIIDLEGTANLMVANAIGMADLVIVPTQGADFMDAWGCKNYAAHTKSGACS